MTPPDNQLCEACQLIRQMIGEEKERRISWEERIALREAALTWADKHLPKIVLANNISAFRLTVDTKDGYTIHIGKKLIAETFTKCKNSRRLAKTISAITHLEEWIGTAIHVRTEAGRHHNFNFEVFEAQYKDNIIEFKAKQTDGLIAYIMRIISKK